MSKYTDWSSIGQREDAIASSRFAAELLRSVPTASGLSASARRDAALTELLAESAGVDEAFQYVHTQAGSTFDAQFLAAYAALPATGGVIDASRMLGSQVCASRLTIAKPCRIILPHRADITANEGLFKVTADNVSIIGGGGRSTVVSCAKAWDGTNLFGIEVEDADGFSLSETGLLVTRSGSDVHQATNGMGVYIHGAARHWLVENNDIAANGTEPDSEMRYLGIFAWTATSTFPITCGDGVISGNRVHDTDGRCIEVALCENVAIVKNPVTLGGSDATIVAVGVRVIGSENISVVANPIDITGGAALGNADCIQVNGDNVSTNISIVGNPCRTNANGGTGIKIGGNSSYVTCVGNDVYYDGASTAPYGILVTSNPGAPEAPPTHILVSGNRVKGFGSQLGIDREGGGDTYPDTVAFLDNQLGARFDGAATLGVFYNLNSVDIVANNILLHGNQVASTSLDTMVERFQGLVQAAAFQVGTAPAQQGSLRVENGSAAGVYARNAADDADIALIAATSADNVLVGGTGAANVGFSNGTDVARMLAGGHWAPAAATQDLGSDSEPWRALYLSGSLDHEGTTAGFFGATPTTQPTVVADPAGGGTQDAEARTAIIAIIDKLQALGLMGT